MYCSILAHQYFSFTYTCHGFYTSLFVIFDSVYEQSYRPPRAERSCLYVTKYLHLVTKNYNSARCLNTSVIIALRAFWNAISVVNLR